MVNEQETLKELKKFCYKSMNKLLWIPIWAFILFPAIMEFFGIGKNGYVMSVILAIVVLVFLKIRRPPFLFFQGDNDALVDPSSSRCLYDLLVENGSDSDYYLVEGAMHCDTLFTQEAIQNIVLDFLKKHV